MAQKSSKNVIKCLLRRELERGEEPSRVKGTSGPGSGFSCREREGKILRSYKAAGGCDQPWPWGGRAGAETQAGADGHGGHVAARAEVGSGWTVGGEGPARCTHEPGESGRKNLGVDVHQGSRWENGPAAGTSASLGGRGRRPSLLCVVLQLSGHQPESHLCSAE